MRHTLRIAHALLIALIVSVAGCTHETQETPIPESNQPLAQSRASEEVALHKAEKRDVAAGQTALAVPASKPSHVYFEGDDLRSASEPLNTENYGHFDDNPVKRVAEAAVSTFSIDVDTGSYANVRRFLNQRQLPREDAVRVEEMINYFSYDYPSPTDRSRPFSVTTEIAPTAWNRDTYLLRVGLKGYDVAPEKLPPANLVFLVDVSGSMMDDNKLPLLVSGLKLLVKKLKSHDRVAIVVYAGASGVVLEPTSGDQKDKIISALDRLSAGGSTNGAAGIQLAYAVARQAYIPNGINRVLLATDGDFNVGTVSFEALKDLIEQKRKSGVSLTTLGFGAGNYNDHLMEQLADAGNGNYAYIDTINEAQKVLVDEMSSTLQTIAKDVKIQVEFNPAVVTEYRLIGYENRALKREDFNNDKIDAGDIGAGHTVTALYEIALVNGKGQRLESLRYGKDEKADANTNELAWLRLRYKLPTSESSALIEQPVAVADIKKDIAKASADFRFTSAVAAFGQLLRGGKYTGNFSYQDALALARDARGKDAFGYRGELVSLMNVAKTLDVAGNRQANAKVSD